MHCIKLIVRSLRLVGTFNGPVQCLVSSSSLLKYVNVTSVAGTQAIAMSQRSITSFFTKTPKKSEEEPSSKQVKTPETKASLLKQSPSETNTKSFIKSPTANGDSKRASAKRQRIASSSSEDQSPKKVAPSPVESPVDEKTLKRPRLLSSESDSKSPVKPSSSEKKKTKRHRIESSSSDSAPESSVKTEIKEEKPTPVKTYASPQTKKQIATLKTSVEKKAKQAKTLKPKEEKKSPLIERNVKVENDTKTESETNGKSSKDNKEGGERVAEADYNPNKAKYSPIADACWARGAPVPYLALARTLEAIEGTSARLKMIEILSNYFRSVLVLTPADLLPSVYLCLNQLAPAYHSVELGIAETYLMKAIGQSTGRSLAQVKASAAKSGDLGLVAEEARAAQRVMFPAPPLVLRKVFAALREVANMTGQSSVNKKISKIQSLYVACRHSEARYLIRSLAGKLRIGLAEQSVLQALAQCVTATPPCQEYPPAVLDASRGLTAEEFKAKIEENAHIIKSTYCECPNYDQIIPVLVERGVAALPDHCRLTPGVPLKPMLAHPTKGVSEVFDRFEGLEFTCEWKYDGERAQIHVPAAAGEEQADVSNASIFSRNQENNTSKYPDILRRLPGLLKPSVQSCVLDCEAVAYDVEKKQILPFQILSTRKRKDASEGDIKVQVCVFVFDLLYLNGRALVRRPLRARRELLREHFREVAGEWQFATSADCSTMEEVQQFLEESVKGSCEGLMVKTLAGKDATYEIARRSRNWLKLKKDYLDGVGDTIDAVVIGAYRGKGKRAGLYGTFLLACYDPDSEEFQSLCKIGTGFSDEQLKEWSEALKPLEIEQPRSYYRYDSSHSPDAWFSAARVMEVRCADLSLSPAHRAAIGRVEPDKGVSLRFPRFVRVRDDKTPEQATSAQQIAEMYLAQDQVKNTGAKAKNEDDFY